jgi:hypothetical protein
LTILPTAGTAEYRQVPLYHMMTNHFFSPMPVWFSLNDFLPGRKKEITTGQLPPKNVSEPAESIMILKM